MGLFPIQIGIQRSDDLRKFGVKVITPCEVDPLVLGDCFGDILVRDVLIEDRNYPFVVECGVIDFFSGVSLHYRIRADHEEKILGSLDVVKDFLQPLRSRLDVFLIEPNFAFFRAEGDDEFLNEALVLAGVRDENLRHFSPP
jgi:hypothetical protein